MDTKIRSAQVLYAASRSREFCSRGFCIRGFCNRGFYQRWMVNTVVYVLKKIHGSCMSCRSNSCGSRQARALHVHRKCPSFLFSLSSSVEEGTPAQNICVASNIFPVIPTYGTIENRGDEMGPVVKEDFKGWFVIASIADLLEQSS